MFLMSEYYVSNLFYDACENGDLEACKWLHDSSSYLRCTYDAYKCFSIAIENGNLQVCKWLHKKYYYCIDNYCYIFNLACLNNHFKICEWLYEENIYVKDYGNHFKDVCENGQYDMARWIYRYDPENSKKNVNIALTLAYIGEHMKICEWLVKLCPNVELDGGITWEPDYEKAYTWLSDYKANVKN
jgi:hypothetical protein